MTDRSVYDVVVVGGGLLGAGIARDAALRGLSVALLEKEDFGAGAVARSSRLALGGLTALGTLDFTRVREDIREREILRHIAPHLVRPQSCLLPFYDHGLLAQTRLRAGLALSDALSFDLSLRVHQLLSVGAARKRAPGLSPEGLIGAALVSEASIPDTARLTRELAWDARRQGAVLHTHTQAVDLRREPGRQGRERVTGVHWKNGLTGASGFTEASLVVLAAGRGARRLWEEAAARSSWIKTVSLVGPALPGAGDVLIFPSEDAPALLLAAPRPDGCWIGELSVDAGSGLDAPYATGVEVAALLKALHTTLPGLEPGAVRRAEASVHAVVVPGREVEDPAVDGGRCEGLLLASGAGITRFRRVAEDAVDLACRKLGRALSAPPSRTASTPLPERTASDWSSLPDAVESAVAEEECRTLRDCLERRAPLEWSERERRAHLPEVLRVMASTLGWDKARQAAEVKAWDTELALGQTFQVL